MKITLIDKAYYTDTAQWNSQFKEQALGLPTAQWDRYVFLASTRIKNIVNKQFTLIDELEIQEREAVKQATSIMIDYWLEYGLNLNRISGSVSMGGYSASENPPADPDYIPDMVYEVLETVGLYSYAGLAYSGCPVEEEIYYYQWDGFRLPFKFSLIADTRDEILNSKEYPQNSYAYSKIDKHWYVFRGASWNDLGVMGMQGLPGKDGKDGKSITVKGEKATLAEVIAVPNPQTDDVWIVAGEMILWNGSKWVNVGAFGKAITESNFREIDKEGQKALVSRRGQVILLEDLSGRPIVTSLGNAAASQDYVLERTVSDEFEKVVKIEDLSITPPNANGGHLSYQEHFGSLDTTVGRLNFLGYAHKGHWYTFLVNGESIQAFIYGGTTDTAWQWVGFKEFTGPNGISMEIVKGSTTEIGNSVQAAPLLGEMFANTIAQPISYGALQYLPKDVIVQLINDTIAPAINNANDPTWRDLDGTQVTQFTPAQITITLTDSGIAADENIQLILGSTAGDLVLDETIKVYPNVATAAQNGYVAGQYKWYMYVDGTDVKFVMEDSAGALTDTTQVISKIRRVTPRVQTMTAKYTTQQDILLKSTWIGDLAKSASKEVTLPTGITTDTMTQIGLSVSGTTDWETVSGWDKVTPFYISVMTEDTTNTWWIEYKVEAVPGDNTKIKVTNFISGNQNDKAQAYKAHWMHFKGGL